MQREYAKITFSRGSAVHNGKVLNEPPTGQGFWAVFTTENEEEVYVGPFETEKEVELVGSTWRNYRGYIKV